MFFRTAKWCDQTLIRIKTHGCFSLFIQILTCRSQIVPWKTHWTFPKDGYFLQCSSLDGKHKQRDHASPTETAPLIGGDVIAHSKQPLTYCLLFSFEGRLKNLLCHLIFQWDGSTIELHCAWFVWWVLGIHSNTAYQSPRGLSQ